MGYPNEADGEGVEGPGSFAPLTPSTPLVRPYYPPPPRLTPQPRRHPVRLVLGLTAVGLAIVIAIASTFLAVNPDAMRLVSRVSSTASIGPAAAHAAIATPALSSPADVRDDAIDALVKTMNQALATGSVSRFVSVAAPTAKGLQARLKARFVALRQIPFTSVKYSWTRASTPSLNQQTYGDSARLVMLSVTYDLSGWDQKPFTESVGLTFAGRSGRWYAVDDSEDDGRIENSRFCEPWAVGSIVVEKRAHVLVLSDPAHRQQAARLATEVDALARDTRALWPSTPWNGRVVVLAHTDKRFVNCWFAGKQRTDGPAPSGQAQYDAQVTALGSSGNGVDSDGLAPPERMIVTPYLLAHDDSYSQIVLRHELTHVALYALGHRSPPSWLVEGMAEYGSVRAIGHPGDGLGEFQHHGIQLATAAELKRNTWKPLLAADTASFYDANAETVADAYTSAWLTCLFIADHYGEPKLRALYNAAANSPRTLTPTQVETRMLSSVLHTDRPALLKAVKSYAHDLRSHFVIRATG